jgi:branched-chain amino acid aminotransferase
MDGRLVDFEDAKVHVLSHCLHYGTGVFEGIRIYDTAQGRAIFRLEEHMRRFLESAKMIELNVPYRLDELCEACRQVARSAPPEGDYLRPIAFFGLNPEGNIGVSPKRMPTNVAIACTRMGAYVGHDQLEKGAKVITSSYEKPSSRAALLTAKASGNYLNSVLARLEAIRNGADEAVMLNADGTVAEGTGENIFIIRRGEISTPPLSSGILEGITRDSIIVLASENGREVRQREITRAELYTADEVFMTGTAAEVTPVGVMDGMTIGKGGPGPVTKELQQAFARAVRGEDARHSAWLDRI